MITTFGHIFKDKLDTVLDVAIADQFLERQREREEGPAELANPQVIPQPVHHPVDNLETCYLVG